MDDDDEKNSRKADKQNELLHNLWKRSEKDLDELKIWRESLNNDN